MKHPSSRRVIGRTLLLCVLAAVLTVTTLVAGDLFSGKLSPKPSVQELPPAPETMRAMTVPIAEGSFPSRAGLPALEQQKELDALVEFASSRGFNTLVYEAVASGKAAFKTKLFPASSAWTGTQDRLVFFDPLDYLVNASKEQGIRVYATIDLADSSTRELLADTVTELTQQYDLAGVVLAGMTPASASEQPRSAQDNAKLLREAEQALRRDRQLGMLADGELIGSADDPFSTGLQDHLLDFVMPVFTQNPLDTASGLSTLLEQWELLCAQTDTAYYPYFEIQNEDATVHRAENTLYQALGHGAGGSVFSSYATLHTASPFAATQLTASFAQVAPETDLPPLTFDQTFNITRPADQITVGADWQNYFIAGTSNPDPARPVVYENKELDRSPGGLWGAFVRLESGTNTFTFTQGDVTKSITIVRPTASGSTGISAITKSSAYPQNSELVLAGGKLKLSCTAPSGGTVTATVGGLTTTLTPVSTAQKGTAMVYQAQIDLSGLARAGQTTAIGPVTYTLNYDGYKSFQDSAGTVYAVGTDAVPVVRMNMFASCVNTNAANDGSYLTILRKGCVDVVTANIGDYYQLSCGGHIPKSAVTVETGAATATNEIHRILLEKNEKGEKLRISGTLRPAFTGNLSGDTLTVTLYNMSGWDRVNTAALRSELCETITSEEQEDGSVRITFRLRDSVELLGWDMLFEENETLIYLKRQPVIDLQSPQPLTGITVALDPGHGGSDPGAIGVPGQLGPSESILNMYNAYALRSRLEALGAQVHLLHENQTMTLDERMELSQKYDADLFISSHHNSVGDTSNAGTASGIEVYYWNDQSKTFADQIGANLSEQSGRKLRFTEQSWYRVTMTNACPAVLVESGFICNPREYEEIADEFAMYRYANAIADAVLQYFLPTAEQGAST